MKNYQQNFDSYIQEIGKKFPTIKRTLIDERNQHMVLKLIALHEKHQKIIAYVDDGHVFGVSKLIEEKQVSFKTIRSQEFQNWKFQRSMGRLPMFYLFISYNKKQSRLCAEISLTS